MTKAAILFQEDSNEPNHRAAIEGFPHLIQKICLMWKSQELDTYFHRVLLDTRDGKRQGFPREVASEILFLAELNALVRAMDAATALQIPNDEARHMIAIGDGIARGFSSPKQDPWSLYGPLPPEPRSPSWELVRAPAVTQDKIPARLMGPPVKPVLKAVPSIAPVKPAPAPVAPVHLAATDHYISLFLKEIPPIPSLVRLELTAKAAGSPASAVKAMDWEFFRCICQEIGNLGVEELLLYHQGNPGKCPWVARAIRFAKQQCHFPQVNLRVDLLTASDRQLEEAILAGLDWLVLDFPMSSDEWRIRAEGKLAAEPNYFAHRFSNLLQKREEAYSKTEHRCLIKVLQTGRPVPNHSLATVIGNLAEMADLSSVDWLPTHPGMEGEDGSLALSEFGGRRCWMPFVEANIKASGEMVTCRYDSQGISRVADLRSTEFTEAWQGASFRQARQGVLAGDLCGTACEKCPRLGQ